MTANWTLKNNRNVLSYSSGSWKPRTKISPTLPAEGSRIGSSCVSPSARWSQALHGRGWMIPVFPPASHGHLLLSLCLLLFFIFGHLSPGWSRVISSWDLWHNYLCKDPFPQSGHIPRFLGLQYGHIFLEAIIQPTTPFSGDVVHSKSNLKHCASEVLSLKLQYFGHPMRRADSLEKTLMLGKIEDKRRRSGREWDGWIASPTQWTSVWTNSRRQWRTEEPGGLQSTGSRRVRRAWATERQQWRRLQGYWMIHPGSPECYSATGCWILVCHYIYKMNGSCSLDVLNLINQREKQIGHSNTTWTKLEKSHRSDFHGTFAWWFPYSKRCHSLCVHLPLNLLNQKNENWWKKGSVKVNKGDVFPGEISLSHKYVCLNIKNKGRHLVKQCTGGITFLKSEQRASQSQKWLTRGQKWWLPEKASTYLCTNPQPGWMPRSKRALSLLSCLSILIF